VAIPAGSQWIGLGWGALAEATQELRLVHWRRAGGAHVDVHELARFESGDVLVICGLPEHLAQLSARVEAL
jgi:isochorismate hydrolase